MKTISVKKIKDKYVVVIPPSPTSAYTLFFYFISLLLLSLIIYIFLAFQLQYIKAFTLSLIPIALFIFNLKINIWNTFGIETLVIDELKIASTLDYNFIYKKRFLEEYIGGGEIILQSSKDGSKIRLGDVISAEHSKSKFRILLIDDGEKIFQSSNFLNFEDANHLQGSLVFPEQSSEEPFQNQKAD